MTREEAKELAAGRKAARAQRNYRIRRGVAILSVAAFLGPFGYMLGNAGNTTTSSGKSATSTVAAVTPASSTSSSSATSSQTTAPLVTRAS